MTNMTFKLGGADWTINYVAEPMENRWQRKDGQNVIDIALNIRGIHMRGDALIKLKWLSIFDVIHDVFLINRGKIWDRYRMAVGNAIANTLPYISTAPISTEHKNYVTVMGTIYEIVIDNEKCAEDRVYGRCDPNTFTILLSTKDMKGDYHPQVIKQVLFHEIMHAINWELGLQHTKWDEETQVNTLANYLAEVYFTMQPKLTENATDTESPKT